MLTDITAKCFADADEHTLQWDWKELILNLLYKTFLYKLKKNTWGCSWLLDSLLVTSGVLVP